MSAHKAGATADLSCDLIAWEIFEAYAKKVIRNYARNLRRSLYRRLKRESFELQDMRFFIAEDHYPSEDFRLLVGNRSYSISNEAVYKGLVRLSKRKLEALILHYWELQTDAQLARRFGVTPRTIRRWRRQSIEDLQRNTHGGTDIAQKDRTIPENSDSPSCNTRGCFCTAGHP